MNTYKKFFALALIECLVASLAFAQPQLANEFQRENFDRDPVKGWEFSCEKEFVQEGEGRVLRVWGAGHALPVVERGDFSVAFRYRSKSGGGDGDILFRASDQGAYSLRLERKQIVLCWRMGSPETGFQEQKLAAKPLPLTADTWHSLSLRVQGRQIDVLVAGKPVMSYTDSASRSAGFVGLGVIANTGAVEYDDVAFDVPGSTPTHPAPKSTTPTPPKPPPKPQQTTDAGTDLAVTDIFATRLRQGEVWIRITNRGPRLLEQQPLRLVTKLDGSPSEKMMTVTLAVGQTEAYNTGRVVDTSQKAVGVTATIEVIGLSDPQSENNTYSETVPRAAVPTTPKPSPGGPTRVNLAVTNLRIDAQNSVHVHLENRSGMIFNGKPCELILVQNGKALLVGPLTLPDLKPKERYFCNTGVKADWSGQKKLHITATVRVPGWADQTPQDNTNFKVFMK
jgi:hypothetical protein